MALGTDRLQIVQGSTAYLMGIIRSRLLAYDTDKEALVYSPDGFTFVPCAMSNEGNIILLDVNGKIPLSYFPDSVLLSHYIHIQSATSTTWVINNPFKRPVNVSFLDSANNPFITDYTYSPDYTTITASIAYAISGKAILN